MLVVRHYTAGGSQIESSNENADLEIGYDNLEYGVVRGAIKPHLRLTYKTQFGHCKVVIRFEEQDLRDMVALAESAGMDVWDYGSDDDGDDDAFFPPTTTVEPQPIVPLLAPPPTPTVTTVAASTASSSASPEYTVNLNVN